MICSTGQMYKYSKIGKLNVYERQFWKIHDQMDQPTKDKWGLYEQFKNKTIKHENFKDSDIQCATALN